MSIQYFRTVNRRIEEERRTKYCGTASLRLASLRYQDQEYKHNVDPKIKKAHVDSITRMFDQEHGCRKEDERHHVKALISQQELEAAILRASITIERLKADVVPYPELEFPIHVKIECLEGHDLLVAADKKLQGPNKRWIVDLYLDDLSDELRVSLADGYDYQKKPDSGELYIKIRQFQGFYGESNPFFEKMWLGRLATNLNSWNLFKRLSKNRKFSAAFDALLDVPSLFGGFRLSVMHQLLGMKCDEPNLVYLRHIYTWWNNVCDGDKEVMRQITKKTIGALQGMAPGASSTDRALLQAQLRSGSIFENFSVSQREELWQRACSASQQCLIPSLFTFFEDRKFLNDAAGCIMKILDVNENSTIISSLEEIFSDTNQEEGKCVIQLSETEFGTIAGDSNRRLDLGIRQLWLAAFRNYRELPAGTQKSDVLALSRTKSDETTLNELAHLASRLGFESDKLCEIIQTCPDRKIAEHALLTARKPGRFEFHDLESCIQQIVAAFNAADQVRTSETTGEAMEVMREIDKPPNRCGRPHDIDYQYDRTQLFLPLMPSYLNTDMGEITSTFIRWSVYCAYFGPPPIIENISPSRDLVRNTIVLEEDGCFDYEYIEFSNENSSIEVPTGEGSETFVTASHELQPGQTKLSESKLSANELQRQMPIKERIFDEIVQDIEEKTKERDNLQQELDIEHQRLREAEQKKQELNLHIMKLQDVSTKEQLSLDEITRHVEEKSKERYELQQELKNEQTILSKIKQERQQITAFISKIQQDSVIKEHSLEDMPQEVEKMIKEDKILQTPVGGYRKSNKRMKIKKVNLKKLRRLPQAKRKELPKVGKEIESKEAELANIQHALTIAKQDLQSIYEQIEKEQGYLKGIREDLTTECMQHANEITAQRKAELERHREEISTTQELLKKANNELQQINSEIQKQSTELERVKNSYTIQEANLQRINNELQEKILELEQNKNNYNKQEKILREINENIQNKQAELRKIEDDSKKEKIIIRETNDNGQKKQLDFGEIEGFLGAEQELLRVADTGDQWQYEMDNNMHNLEDQISFEEQEHPQKKFQTYGKGLRKRAQLGPKKKNQETEEKKEQAKSSQISDDKEIEAIQLSDSSSKNKATPRMSEGNLSAFPEGQGLHETNQELMEKNKQLMKLKENIVSKQQIVHELDRKLEKLQQDIVDREGNVNELIGQLQEKDLELRKLQREVVKEQAKLDQLQTTVPQRSHRSLVLTYSQLMRHDPNNKGKVRVDFVNHVSNHLYNSESMFVISDTLVVDPSNPEEVTNVARRYVRKSFTLGKRDMTAITPENCFEEVAKDGSYIIVLIYKDQEDDEPTEVLPRIRKEKERDMNEDKDGRKKKKFKHSTGSDLEQGNNSPI